MVKDGDSLEERLPSLAEKLPQFLIVKALAIQHKNQFKLGCFRQEVQQEGVKQYLLIPLMKVGKLVELLLLDYFGAKHDSEELISKEVDIEFLGGEQIVKERVGGEKLLGDKLIKHLLHDLHPILLHSQAAATTVLHSYKAPRIIIAQQRKNR